MKKSKAAMEATRRYEAKTYDRVLILFPRGTRERIKALGFTVNGFTKDSVKQRLEALEQSQGRPASDLPAE